MARVLHTQGLGPNSANRGVVLNADIKINLWEEIEGHPAILQLLASVAREAGYNVEYSLKWGFRWVDIKYEPSTTSVR
jgi:hypothetical protein